MKNKLPFIILSLLFLVSNSQEKKVENGTINIEFLKSKKVSNTLHLNSSTRLKSKELKKINVKCKIKSLNKEKIDINKVSLIDHNNKLRYRPTDISYQPIMGYFGYEKLLKEDIKKNTGENNTGHRYKPEIKDTFLDYSIDGYTNIEIPMSFPVGFTKKEKSIVYFHPHKFNSFKALIFFAIIKKAENPQLELYYGDEKIADVEI